MFRCTCQDRIISRTCIAHLRLELECIEMVPVSLCQPSIMTNFMTVIVFQCIVTRLDDDT